MLMKMKKLMKIIQTHELRKMRQTNKLTLKLKINLLYYSADTYYVLPNFIKNKD